MIHLWKCLPLLLLSMLAGERARDRNTAVGRGIEEMERWLRADDVDVGDFYLLLCVHHAW